MKEKRSSLGCIHINIAKRFLFSYLKLSEDTFSSVYDICYNKQCNNGNVKERNSYGIQRKEYDTPMGFAGVGLRQSSYLPLEMRKLFKSIENCCRNNESDDLDLDDKLGDVGEPTYREINISSEKGRESVRNMFENNVFSNIDGKPYEDENYNKNKILEWYKEKSPIWNENDHAVTSGVFKSTPDWKRLVYYKDKTSCEWGSAVVILLIQFWQTSLSYTDLIVNNKDLSIVEYVGGNEESCIPLRILVKFERKNGELNDNSKGSLVVFDKAKQTGCRTESSSNIKSFNLSISRNRIGDSELDDENEKIDSVKECSNKNIESCFILRYLDMVKYIEVKDLSNEFCHLEGKFKDSVGKDICYLYMDHPNDFQLKFQSKYDKDVLQLIKSCIKGRKYDSESKLWLFPVETIYESVRMVDFLGGKINQIVLSVLINGSKFKSYLKSSLYSQSCMKLGSLFCPDDELVEKWESYLPKASRNTWFRYKVRFHIEDIFPNKYHGGIRNKKHDNSIYFHLDLNTENNGVEYQKDQVLRILRNNNIYIKWDEKVKLWRLKVEQVVKVISIFKENLGFYYSSVLDSIVYEQIQKESKCVDLQLKTANLKTNEIKTSPILNKFNRISSNKNMLSYVVCDKDENRCSKNYLDEDGGIRCYKKARISDDSDEDTNSDLCADDLDDDESEDFGEKRQIIILSCLGKDEYDNMRLESKIEKMIRDINIPKHFEKIEFVMWPKHYKEWMSISFLVVSKDTKLDNYHPKLLLSLISNVMIVKENMIDYITRKSTWPDNSFETTFEITNSIPSLESRLYISEGIFCKTKLFIAGDPSGNHFKLCTRLATLGNASFVHNPLLADYIVICDEKDESAIEIKRSVPKKQATKVQNTHGETHSIQVTPKWIYDVVLEFSIIKPTSKRNHKAWVSENY